MTSKSFILFVGHVAWKWHIGFFISIFPASLSFFNAFFKACITKGSLIIWVIIDTNKLPDNFASISYNGL